MKSSTLQATVFFPLAARGMATFPGKSGDNCFTRLTFSNAAVMQGTDQKHRGAISKNLQRTGSNNFYWQPTGTKQF